ncbi:glycosyl transferase family 2 [Dyadobacter jejuensis]|uniref:Glycosyl transferase family 2 n=1 Tax=Dyadobacter jejuensis TaxID=1082580 RepID=A0A316AHQ2_9BACT|nr:glycosyltransferase [Dyadobacter jejuensis]PWJ56789.1 glycosyl transferase family 2 [Dyadobacter jejuensis]
MSFYFPETTLLITHYNRSQSLKRLLDAFIQLGCQFGEVIVSDDASGDQQLKELHTLQSQYDFRLITTPINMGLGDNINKGQRAVSTPYTLYVQEDFVPKDGFPEHYKEAVRMMQEDSSLDIIRFYAYFAYPQLKHYGQGFEEMVFSYWNPDHIKFYMYSDHPHLRRTSFPSKFGPYATDIGPNETEFQMALRFLKKKGRGLFFKEYTTLFDQINTSSEPSMIQKSNWRTGKNPIILLIRQMYLVFRWLKNTIQLVLTRP